MSSTFRAKPCSVLEEIYSSGIHLTFINFNKLRVLIFILAHLSFYINSTINISVDFSIF